MYENLDRVINRMENLKSAEYFHECAQSQNLQYDSDICIAELLLRETDLCEMIMSDKINDSRINGIISYFTVKTGVSPKKTAEIISRFLKMAPSTQKIKKDSVADYTDAVRKYNYGWSCNVDTDIMLERLCADAENKNSPTCKDSMSTIIEMHKEGNRKATVYVAKQMNPVKEGNTIVEMLKDAFESGMPSAAGDLACFYARYGYTFSAYNKALEYYKKPGAVLGCESPQDLRNYYESSRQLNAIVATNRIMKVAELALCLISTIIILLCITKLQLWFAISAATLAIASAVYIFFNLRKEKIISPYGILILQGCTWITLLFYLI